MNSFRGRTLAGSTALAVSWGNASDFSVNQVGGPRH
jgi:hypothetical protein